METTEADSEIEEEHLINFVVNSLNDELAINLSEDVEVTTETFQSDDHGIAITEGTWEYGGLWDSDERVIMIHQNLWSHLDYDARRFLLKHEIYERRRAVNEFGDAIGSTVGQSDAVAAHHTSVNADLLDELGKSPLKSYARATRNKLVAEGTSDSDAIE